MNIRYAERKDVSQLSDLFQREIESQQSRVGYYELVTDYNWKWRIGNVCEKIWI